MNPQEKTQPTNPSSQEPNDSMEFDSSIPKEDKVEENDEEYGEDDGEYEDDPGEQLKIHYGENEYGFAERVGHNLVRILNNPIFVNDVLWRGDIVESEEACEGFPEIVSLRYTPYPKRTILEFDSKDAQMFARFATIVQIAGGACMEGFPAPDGKTRCFIVAHPEGLDPELLAEGMGIMGIEPDEEDTGEASPGDALSV